jgi:[acyl-carrier-protein] S-malonyltransferase
LIMAETKFSMVFPGQGSQSLGMLGELAETYPIVEQTYAEASEALGFDLWTLVRQGPQEELNLTMNTQPAMLAAGVAVWRVWKQVQGSTPLFMAGHSLGEYSALVCAGALAFPDAVKIVSARGGFMQKAVPEGSGSMAAILGLNDEKVQEVCRSVNSNKVVEAVNFNAPGQVVIAGEKEAVKQACERLKEVGAKRVMLLPVSVPSHCALMRPAAKKLSEQLKDLNISSPAIPVLHNVNVSPVQDVEKIRNLLIEQLYKPVRWVEAVRRMAEAGCAVLLEVGPGKVLTGLTKRIDRSLTGMAVYDTKSLNLALERL